MEHKKVFSYNEKTWNLLFTFDRFCEEEIFDLKQDFWAIRCFLKHEEQEKTELYDTLSDNDVLKNYGKALNDINTEWLHTKFLDFINETNIKNYELKIVPFEEWEDAYILFFQQILKRVDRPHKLNLKEKCLYL
jgi:hypothetical protein